MQIISKYFENLTETCWPHTQPTKKNSEPKSKWFKRYDQIFKPTISLAFKPIYVWVGLKTKVRTLQKHLIRSNMLL